MADNGHQSVCIVGAGPAGLVLARAFKSLGIAFDVYERHHDVGGIWDQSNPGSPIYDSTHFISSKTQSNFPDFDMPAHYPDYPSHAQIHDYLTAFTKAYGLRDSMHFNTSVDHVASEGDLWNVRLSCGEVHSYRWLVAASGANWHPRLPSYPGKFDGEARHSAAYNSTDEFRGKRVLVIGGGNSGCDIACDAAQSAEAAFISLRRGYHFIPKHMFGKPFDVFARGGRHLPVWLSRFLLHRLLRLLNGDPRRFGLQKPDHNVLESHPILNSQIFHYLSHGDLIAKPDVRCFEGPEVVFNDGTREPIDLVIYATGYRWRLPYLDEGLIKWQDGHPDLYLGMFSREHPGLFVLGLFETNAGAYRLFDNMADLIGRAILVQRDDPEQAQRLADLVRSDRPNLTGGMHYVASERHAGYLEFGAYTRNMNRLRRHMQWPQTEPGHYERIRVPQPDAGCSLHQHQPSRG